MIKLFLKKLFAPVKEWFKDLFRNVIPMVLGLITLYVIIIAASYGVGFLIFKYYHFIDKGNGEMLAVGGLSLFALVIVCALIWLIVTTAFSIYWHFKKCWQEAKYIKSLNPFKDNEDEY